MWQHHLEDRLFYAALARQTRWGQFLMWCSVVVGVFRDLRDWQADLRRSRRMARAAKQVVPLPPTPAPQPLIEQPQAQTRAAERQLRERARRESTSVGRPKPPAPRRPATPQPGGRAAKAGEAPAAKNRRKPKQAEAGSEGRSLPSAPSRDGQGSGQRRKPRQARRSKTNSGGPNSPPPLWRDAAMLLGLLPHGTSLRRAARPAGDPIRHRRASADRQASGQCAPQPK